MMGRFLFLAAGFMFFLASGCATRPLPGTAGEVSGALQSIELHTKWPERGELYPTFAREREAASRILGVMLRDELARRFPIVEGPQSTPESSEAAVLLTPTLLISPDIDGDSRLELEVADLATKAVRTFNFKSSAGREKLGYEAVLGFDVEAVDLAARAASSPELLEFLMRTTQAVPE